MLLNLFFSQGAHNNNNNNNIQKFNRQPQQPEQENIKKKKKPKEELVTIDHFEQYYFHTMVVEEGSAGMDGAAVVNSANEKDAEELSLTHFGFNELASSKISLERSIPDNRHPSCSQVKYPKSLPAASVIIIFHNEVRIGSAGGILGLQLNRRRREINGHVGLDSFQNSWKFGKLNGRKDQAESADLYTDIIFGCYIWNQYPLFFLMTFTRI